MNMATKYEKKPHHWNLAIMITVGSLLWSALAFYITTGVNNHSMSETSHPAITSQLQDIRSDQLKEQILKMDDRICAEPNNRYYRQELLSLITKWENINSPRKFPTQLLRCINGNT